MPKMTSVHRATPKLPSNGPPWDPACPRRTPVAAPPSGGAGEDAQAQEESLCFRSGSHRSEAARRPTTTAKSGASIIAAVTIMAVLIWLAARAGGPSPLVALPPTRPMPRPQPITGETGADGAAHLGEARGGRGRSHRAALLGESRGANMRQKPTTTRARTIWVPLAVHDVSFLEWFRAWVAKVDEDGCVTGGQCAEARAEPLCSSSRVLVFVVMDADRHADEEGSQEGRR